MGGISESKPSASSPTSICLTIAPVHENVEFLLQRYWAFEEVPGDSSSLTKEEQAAVTHFRETHSRVVMWYVYPSRSHVRAWQVQGSGSSSLLVQRTCSEEERQVELVQPRSSRIPPDGSC